MRKIYNQGKFGAAVGCSVEVSKARTLSIIERALDALQGGSVPQLPIMVGKGFVPRPGDAVIERHAKTLSGVCPHCGCNTWENSWDQNWGPARNARCAECGKVFSVYFENGNLCSSK